jgi:hypothetical protein
MEIRSALASGSIKVGLRIADLSSEAYNLLKWLDYVRGWVGTPGRHAVITNGMEKALSSRGIKNEF